MSFQKKHKDHMNLICKQTVSFIQDKYKKGQKKYGTYLPDMNREELLRNILEELIDGITYVLTAMQNEENKEVKTKTPYSKKM
jgi:hypothetical protein